MTMAVGFIYDAFAKFSLARNEEPMTHVEWNRQLEGGKSARLPRKRFYIAVYDGVRFIVSLDPKLADKHNYDWLLGSFKSRALAEYVLGRDDVYTEHQAMNEVDKEIRACCGQRKL
jgi:hypothetical protein